MVQDLNGIEHGAILSVANRQSIICAVALSIYIKEETGKEFRVVYAGKLEDVDEILFQHADIKDYFSDKSLRISVDYKDTDVSAINWEKNDKIGKFSFYLDPVNNNFDLSRVNIEFEGKDTDMVILVGADSPADLGQFYERNRADLEKAKSVVIQPENDKTNLIATLMKKFMEWKYIPSEKVSAILLYGLQEALSAEPIELNKEEKTGTYNYLVD